MTTQANIAAGLGAAALGLIMAFAAQSTALAQPSGKAAQFFAQRPAPALAAPSAQDVAKPAAAKVGGYCYRTLPPINPHAPIPRVVKVPCSPGMKGDQPGGAPSPGALR